MNGLCIEPPFLSSKKKHTPIYLKLQKDIKYFLNIKHSNIKIVSCELDFSDTSF